MRALIIDDERLARAEMRRLLAAHPQIEIVGEAVDGDSARAKVEKLKPDMMFLDVQMPGASGFELLEQLDSVPQVVFTTAFDEYALRAFEVNALDYLLKPIAPERLAVAVGKALEIQRAPRPALGGEQKIFLKDGERCWFVKLKEIALLESEGNYTRIYFAANRPLVPRSLNALEERLNRSLFFRVSRRHVVNLQSIESMEPSVSGGMMVKLKGGLEVEMSRRKTAEFKETMGL